MRWLIALILLVACMGCVTTQLLEGRVNLFGPAPTAYVGLMTPEGKHARLTGPLAEELRRDYQGKKVRLQVVPVAPAKGPGMPAEYEVREIETPKK